MDPDVIDPNADPGDPTDPGEGTVAEPEGPSAPTAEERRDARIFELVEAGLVVTGSHPMASAEDPHVVVAYRLDILDPTNRSRSRLEAQEAATKVELEGLIDWTPAPVVWEPEPSEGDQYDEVEPPVEGPEPDPDTEE